MNKVSRDIFKKVSLHGNIRGLTIDPTEYLDSNTSLLEDFSHRSLFSAIKELKSVRCRRELDNALANSALLLHRSLSAFWIFIEKETSHVLHEFNNGLPGLIQADFKKAALLACHKHFTDDDRFEEENASFNWISMSFGLSSYCERNACFLCIPKSENPLSPDQLNAKFLLPYIHATFNNALYHENTDNVIKISSRQKQIAEWMAKGKTNQEIALILSVSQFTIKNHIANIYEKINVVNRAQAIKKLMYLHIIN